MRYMSMMNICFPVISVPFLKLSIMTDFKRRQLLQCKLSFFLQHINFKNFTYLKVRRKQWKRGQIKGIKARGGYTVDFSWKNGKVYYIKISALKEGNVIVRYNGQISRFFFKEGQNKVCLQKTGRK